MLIKNQIYEAVITDYTAEGQGVAKIEGCAVFIPNAIAGERCRVRIEKVGKTWAAGKITELLEKSPHRVNRECPVAKLCGGCDFWHMDYEEECCPCWQPPPAPVTAIRPSILWLPERARPMPASSGPGPIRW